MWHIHRIKQVCGMYIHRIKQMCGMYIEFNEWDLKAAAQCDSPPPQNIQDTFDWK